MNRILRMLAQKHTVELSLWRFFRGVKTVDFQSLFIIGLSLLSSCDTVEIGMRDLLGFIGPSGCLHSVVQPWPTLRPYGLQAGLLCPWGVSRQEYWGGLPLPTQIWLSILK